MDPNNSQGYIDEVNSKADPVRVLELIGYAVDKIHVSAATKSVKAFCPIHQDTKVRNLVIEADRNAFQCTLRSCAGHGGGTLVELYAMVRNMDPLRAAMELATRLGLEINPLWSKHFSALAVHEAEELAEAGDVSGALEALERARALDPLSDQLLIASAKIHLSQGDPYQAAETLSIAIEDRLNNGQFEAAEALIAQAIDLLPDSEDIFFLQVRAAELQGRTSEVAALLRDLASAREASGRSQDNEGIYKKLVEMLPEDPDARLDLAKFYESRRMIKQSLKELEIAAFQLIRLGREEEAIPLLEKVLKQEPMRHPNRNALVEVYRKQGNLQRAQALVLDQISIFLESQDTYQAEQVARKWLEWDPENIEIREALARILQEVEMVAEASAELLECARILRERGEYEAEIQYLFRVKFLLPEDRDLRRRIVERLKETGQNQRAAFELLDFSEVLYSSGEDEAAEAALEEATKVDSSPTFQMQVAENLLYRGRNESARDLLLRASRQFELDGQYEEALPCVERLLELDPDDLVVAQARARIMWKIGDPRAGEVSVQLIPLLVMDGRESAAVSLLNQAAESITEPDLTTRALFFLAAELEERDIAAALYWISAPLTRLEDPATAFAMAQALNRIDPMNEPVIRDMADLGAALGRTQEAVIAYIDLSHRLRARNDLSGALEDLVRAERLDTRRADILHLQIDLLETLKGPEAALQKRREYLIRLKAQEQENLESVIAAFEEFLADHPQDPLILRELAEVYARIGNLTESTARFRRLLEGAEKRGDLEEIVEIRQVILRLEPDDPFANANLALALDEVGDHTRAVEMYARAAQLYLKMGAVELAELQLNRGIELDPENPAILDLIISIQRQQGNIAAVREGLWKLSQVLRKAERYDAATARLVELRTLAPEWIEPLRALAETQEILNDTLQAVSTYMELARRLESEGVPKEAMRIYAHICNNLRFDVDALREWSRLAEDIGTDSERRDVYLRYAQAMIEMRQWNDARRALAKVDSLVPDGTATAALREKLGIGLADDPLSSGLELRQAALGYRILGQIDEAMRCLRLAIERMPDDPEACGILSELLASENQVAESIRYRFAQIRGLLHRGDAGPEVEQLIKATCKVLTESAGDLITLAKTLVDGGRRDLAIPIFEQAVKLAEDDFVTVLQATDSDIESTQSSPVLRHAHITALVELGSATDAAEWCRETAARLQNLGDREGSLDMALSLVELLPSDPQSHVTLGQAFLALDKNSEAHDAFLKATELVSGPNGDPQAASEYLNLAVTADSSRPESRTALARLLADLGQTKEAADAWYHAARLYFQNGDVDSAESALLESTKLQPRAVDAIRLLAEIRRQRDGFPAALPVYRSYLTLIQETSAEAQIEKAFREVAAIEEGSTEIRAALANWLCTVAGRTDDGKKEYIALAQLCENNRETWAKAIEYYSLATTVQPEDSDAFLFEAIAAIHERNQVLQFAAEALREASRLHEMGNRISEAISAMVRVTSYGGKVSSLDDYLRLGALQRLAGLNQDALATYRLAREHAAELTSNRLREVTGILIELDPSDEQAALDYLDVLPNKQVDRKAVTIARSFYSSGNMEAYERILSKALQRVPDSLALRVERVAGRSTAALNAAERRNLGTELAEIVRIAISQGQQEVASDAVAQLEVLGPEAMPVQDMASLLLAVGQRDKALSLLIKSAETALESDVRLAVSLIAQVAEIDPNSVPAALVATLVRTRGSGPEARAIAERILESALLARSRNRTLLISAALFEQLDTKARINLMRRILEAAGAPFAVAATATHCEWLRNRARNDEAIEMATCLAEMAPNSPDAWYLLAQIQRQNNLGEQAAISHMKAARLFNEAGALTEEENCLQEALEAVPDNRDILETLANYYQREQRVDEAVSAAQRIVNLAVAEGDFACACSWLRKAVTLQPADPGLRHQLVENLLKVERKDEAIDQLVELARLYVKKGQQEEAADTYRRVHELEPLNESAIAFLLDHAAKENNDEEIIRFTIALAQVRAESNAVGQALQAVRSLQARYPQNLEVLEAVSDMAQRARDQALFRSTALALGRLYLDQKHPITALMHFEGLLDMDPHDPAVLEAAIQTCVQGGMLERAADLSTRLAPIARDRGDAARLLLAGQTLITYDPNRASARHALGEAYYWLDQTDKALAEFRKAADLYLESNRPEDSLQPLRRILAIDPHDSLARRQYAQCLLESGARDEARRAYIDAYQSLDEEPEAEIAAEVVRALLDVAGNDPTAHELAYRHFKKYGQIQEALDEILQLVRIYVRTGRTDAADALLEEGTKLDPDSLTLQLAQLEVARAAGRSDELVLRLLDLADRFTAIGDLVRAADVMEQALQEDPNLTDLRRRLARIYLTLGQDERGIVLANEYVGKLLSTGESEQAREFAEGLLGEFADVPGLAAELGETFIKSFMNDLGARYLAQEAARKGLAPEGRIRLLEKAVKARPRWIDALKQLADAQIAAGDNLAAVGTLDRLITMLIEGKNFNDAVEVIRRQISLRPKDVAPRRRLVEVYSRIGDREQKIDALQGLIDLFISLGRTDEAVDTYRELIQLRPDDPVLLAKFVELFAQVGNDLEIIDEYVRLAEAYAKRNMVVEATQTYEQALAIDRKNAELRDKFVQFLLANGQRSRALLEMRRLAETHVRRGNTNNALQVLQNALAINPRDPEIGIRVAAAMEAAGDHDEAVSTMARAVAVLENYHLDKAIAILREGMSAFPQSILIRRRLVEFLRKAQRNEEAASEARAAAELCCSSGDFDEAEAFYKVVTELAPETQAELREAVVRHAYDPNLQYLDLIRLGDWLAYHGFPEKALDEYRRARALIDDRPSLIQRCIDAILQFMPEDEAIVDYLLLADKYFAQGDFARARKAYEHVLKLDPSNTSARIGKANAIQAEAEGRAGTRSGTRGRMLDNQPLRPLRQQKKPRVDMGELMDAFTDNKES